MKKRIVAALLVGATFTGMTLVTAGPAAARDSSWGCGGYC